MKIYMFKMFFNRSAPPVCTTEEEGVIWGQTFVRHLFPPLSAGLGVAHARWDPRLPSGPRA